MNNKNESTLAARLRNERAFSLLMTADAAAQLVKDGMTIGVSGFTPSGYPKAVPLALAERAKKGDKFKVDLYTGASVGPEIDSAWTEAGIIRRRFPYQTNASLRKDINGGKVAYADMHLSQCAQLISSGALKPVDIAIVEALAITEDGDIIPTTAVGNTPTYLLQAKKVIVELNTRKPLELEGMADIITVPNPPNRTPINICKVSDRVGTTYMKCGFDKIAAIVVTDLPDKTRPFSPPDDVSRKISENIIAFFEQEVAAGRLTNSLLPLQSGVGNVANAVLSGLQNSRFEHLTCYTEVVQDSMLDLIRSEMDIYGNVNSTHIMGSSMMNGIGGSGDFSRNAAITIFSAPSTAKGGKISSVVPMVSHVDHTEHEVMVLVTEQGFADLRGLSPKERAVKIIQNCAHPDFKDALMDYFERACEGNPSHTPHILNEALSWHIRFQKTGSMSV